MAQQNERVNRHARRSVDEVGELNPPAAMFPPEGLNVTEGAITVVPPGVHVETRVLRAAGGNVNLAVIADILRGNIRDRLTLRGREDRGHGVTAVRVREADGDGRGVG